MVKKIFVLLLAAAAVAGISLSASAAGREPPAKLIVYYFHGTFRCNACTSMEKCCLETIKTHFKGALASGKVEFRSVNVEKYGNEHFVNDYQLYSKALVFSLIRDGKEVKFKNLQYIWEYAGDNNGITHYVKSELSSFLKEA